MNIKSINELQSFILKRLKDLKGIDPESLLIMNDLIQMNQLGFITFESQPYSEDYRYVQRPYVNGLYSKKLVPLLAEKLYELNPSVMISENILGDSVLQDKLRLWYVNDEDYKILIAGNLYPMSKAKIENRYMDGYSGNLIKPNREYLEDYFVEVNLDNALSEITDKMSLIQIWDRDFKHGLHNQIVKVLSKIK